MSDQIVADKTVKTFVWLEGIILSCHSTIHFPYVDVLIDLFQTMHDTPDLTEQLKELRNNQYIKVHNIQI